LWLYGFEYFIGDSDERHPGAAGDLTCFPQGMFERWGSYQNMKLFHIM
jgi:hypothetical protein